MAKRKTFTQLAQESFDGGNNEPCASNQSRYCAIMTGAIDSATRPGFEVGHFLGKNGSWNGYMLVFFGRGGTYAVCMNCPFCGTEFTERRPEKK